MYRKGARMERQLMKLLGRRGLGTIRVAGSGGPDVVTSVAGRFVFIECKYSTKECVYVPREEIERETALARKMGADFYLAVKFSRRRWRIIGTDRLHEFATEKSYAVRLSDVPGLPQVTSILDKNLKDYDNERSED
jgi:Holliday junction resolvase